MQRRLIGCFVLLGLLLGLSMPAAANTKAGTAVFFNETGHTLAYNFRLFWDSKDWSSDV